MDAIIVNSKVEEVISLKSRENSTQIMTTMGDSAKGNDNAPRNNDESVYLYILIVISAFGLIGNVLTLMVIFKNISRSLNLMIACMLISDISFIVFTVLSKSNLFDVKIPFQWSIGISGGCAAMIGIERAIAISKPIWFRNNWKVGITIAAITSIILLNVFFDILSYLLPDDLKDRYVLHINISRQVLGRYLPCLIVTVSNILIAIKLSKYARNMAKLSGENNPAIRQTSTVFPLTLIYIICTLPTCVILLVKSGIVSEGNLDDFVWVIRYLTLFNASSNFYFYVLASKNLRKTCVATFCNCCKCRDGSAYRFSTRSKNDDL